MPKFIMTTREAQDARNARIAYLCDMVEEYQALGTVLHGYQNDPVDLDDVGCFV